MKSKLIKVAGSVIGVTSPEKVTQYVSPQLAELSQTERKSWLMGAEGATSGSFTVERLYLVDSDGPSRVFVFARKPLTFTWTLVVQGKRRAYTVKQEDLGISSMADPAEFLDNIAAEVLEVTRFAYTPAYADHPVYRDKAALVRALVKVESLP